jgi:hypothetical protein
MPTTRHPEYCLEEPSIKTYIPFGMTEAMWFSRTENSAIDRAAHAAIYIASEFPGHDAVHAKESALRFGVSVVEVVDRINAVNALVFELPDL